MIEKDDWRLSVGPVYGNEERFRNIPLYYIPFQPLSERWDHEHCAFCWDKFYLHPECLQEGYCTRPQNAPDADWICPECYEDFKEMFGWTLKKGGEDMERLFSLTFYTQPNGEYRDGFDIGVFRTYEEAKAVEILYRKEVLGFKDYPCDAEITAVPVIGENVDAVDCVYRYEGWNVNEDFDEIDIIRSHCYTDRAQAETDYAEAQVQFPRSEWSLNRYRIDQRDWQEGFVRDII